jgi:hypothetical protein
MNINSDFSLSSPHKEKIKIMKKKEWKRMKSKKKK